MPILMTGAGAVTEGYHHRDDYIGRVLALAEAGQTLKEMSAKLGPSPSAISGWLRPYKARLLRCGVCRVPCSRWGALYCTRTCKMRALRWGRKRRGECIDCGTPTAGSARCLEHSRRDRDYNREEKRAYRRGWMRRKRARQRAVGCAHHWVFESPNGPTSVGTCNRCGATKEAVNRFTVTDWDRSGARSVAVKLPALPGQR